MKANHSIQVSVDPVIFTVIENEIYVLLIKRSISPEKGVWALPGGLVNTDFDVDIDSAVLRKLKEKTNVNSPYLEQVGVVGNNSRDPRGWSLTVVYYALIPAHETSFSSSWGASEVRWWHMDCDGDINTKLAFDHDILIKEAASRLRNKVSYTSVATRLLPDKFTFLDIQRIHEDILGLKLEKKSLMRRYLASGIIFDTGLTYKEGAMRPAKLYSLRNKGLHYFERNLEGSR